LKICNDVTILLNLSLTKLTGQADEKVYDVEQPQRAVINEVGLVKDHAVAKRNPLQFNNYFRILLNEINYNCFKILDLTN